MQGFPFPIITYQVITGNYNHYWGFFSFYGIITYQVITGNYNLSNSIDVTCLIITYQVITGNYNCDCVGVHVVGL